MWKAIEKASMTRRKTMTKAVMSLNAASNAWSSRLTMGMLERYLKTLRYVSRASNARRLFSTTVARPTSYRE